MSFGVKLKLAPAATGDTTCPLLALTLQVWVCVSALPGSVNVPLRLTGCPSLTVWSAPPLAVGATLVTVTITVSLCVPPSSSVTV